MRVRTWMPAAAAAGLALIVAVLPASADKPAEGITWKKTVVDKAFRSEGVAIADVNKDGKMDVLAGEVWYEAPDWKMHEIRKPKANYGNGLGSYSDSFQGWTDDLNADGWPDHVVIRFPGEPCYWYENPQGGTGHWKEHLIWKNACNESPQYVDLFGNGKRVLVMGVQPNKGDANKGQMAWFAPGKDPTKPWEMHQISEPSSPGRVIPGTARFSHGLGIGDLNGDGRSSVITTGGWWEQPERDEGKPWKFHPANLGEACADMFVHDMDGDGKADVVSSSAHKFGMWWYQQRPGNGSPTFLRNDLFRELVSETHAMHFADINGDGQKDLVTGKRWWSHGRAEPGHDWPAMLYWFEASKKGGQTLFSPRIIDTDSGVGTQFVVADFNSDSLPDIVTANKKGVYIFEQVRGK